MPPPKFPRNLYTDMPPPKFPATCSSAHPCILQECEGGGSLLVEMEFSLSSRESSFLVSLGESLMSLMV